MIKRNPGIFETDAECMQCEYWSESRRLLYAPATADLVDVQLTSLAGDGGAGGYALAVLRNGCLLETVEIAQQVGPFDGEAVALAQVGQLFCSIRARNEQNTWPRMAASEE